MLAAPTTLNQFLLDERQHFPVAAGELNALIDKVAMACRLVAARIARGALSGPLAATGSANVQGEVRQSPGAVANEVFLRSSEWGGQLAGVVGEDMETPLLIPGPHSRARYLLVFDPLDGSSNIDINGPVGSIFSILRASQDGDVTTADFLQQGAEQACAGYAIYGPSTMLVMTVGAGVHAFTLDPDRDEFVLTRPAIRIPEAASEFAINASNSRFWEPAVRRYVQDCLAGRIGPRRKDFDMRWVASLVAETHRILMRGGVFLHPRDSREPLRPGRLRLLYQANPIAFIIEQAGGRASTGRERMLDIVPETLQQRVPLIFGAREEVELIEAYHPEQSGDDFDAPLFGSRGLFRASV